MIQDWMFYVAAGLLVVTMILLWTSRKRISNLEEVVNYLVNSRNEMRKDIDEDHKKVIRFGKQIEEHQGTMQVCSSTLSDKISKIEKRIDIIEKTPVEEEKAEPDEEDDCNDPPASEVEFWASKSDLADIVYPDNLEKPKPDTSFEWSHKGEIIGYRWVFPSKEQCIPIYGQRYIVVGILHGHETMNDGSPFICTEEATWDRYKFVIDGGTRFDKVYAYIRIPNSSDIMKSILDITLHDKEG